ncbi:MAG: UDP-2,4-diacetamido-2,4,6-trideoxy-beta-L-altropyranose hydrolase [Methanobrevibacter sp.]|jgi:CMP-N-acetylneuraminic acid synthetase/spore coat polysaccharide biosynthesis predicted glycosyltransferase SpsG|nr:UDP-2,4-diacetamido-2,4,6-trideoxy-beta-L-altropyranose hydrolase [Methanobrevibacter sp.]
MYKNKKIIAIIPARGGSKGIPRKNIRLLAGHPLISYVINTVQSSNFVDEFIVTTEDEEIEFISKKFGAKTIKRDGKLADDDITLDPVIYDAVKKWENKNKEKYDYIITIQPTSPLLKSKTLDLAIKQIIDENKDNLISVVNDPHLTWGYDEINNSYYPLYKKRVNRQQLPKSFKETGAIFISKSEFITENSRLGTDISLFEVEFHESIDVDSYLDWWIAEKLLNKKRILIRADAYPEIGTGHIYRGLSLASKLTDHEVMFLLNENSSLGIEIVENFNYPYITHSKENLMEKIEEYDPNIIINDILNTKKEYIQKLKENSYFVVNFEDIGNGSKYADLVFDALYEHQIPQESLYSGYKYYILRDEFFYHPLKEIKHKIKNILITFGGTDPNDLTRKVLNSLLESSYDGKITVILGLGYKDKEGIIDDYLLNENIEIFENVKNISEYMYESDLIFTSAGRTMYEVASLGIPCVCLCQNEREVSHLFGNVENGFINMGLGKEVSANKITDLLEELLEDYDLRFEMNKRMTSIDLTNGFNNIMNIIKKTYKEKRNIKREMNK